jgi:WD40 repeat protein
LFGMEVLSFVRLTGLTADSHEPEACGDSSTHAVAWSLHNVIAAATTVEPVPTSKAQTVNPSNANVSSEAIVILNPARPDSHIIYHTPHRYPITFLEWHPSGSPLLLSADRSSRLCVWEAETHMQEMNCVFSMDTPPLCLAAWINRARSIDDIIASPIHAEQPHCVAPHRTLLTLATSGHVSLFFRGPFNAPWTQIDGFIRSLSGFSSAIVLHGNMHVTCTLVAVSASSPAQAHLYDILLDVDKRSIEILSVGSLGLRDPSNPMRGLYDSTVVAVAGDHVNSGRALFVANLVDPPLSHSECTIFIIPFLSCSFLKINLYTVYK